MQTDIPGALIQLSSYIESEDYRGYDPYDALTSPVFRLPFLNSNKQVRFLGQQFVKRFPFNIRPLSGIKKGKNPVSLGLCIQGYTEMAKADLISKDTANQKCEYLISELMRLAANGYSGICWGYDFPWESKHFRLKAYEPSVVATGIITNGIYQYYLSTKNQNAGEMITSAARYVLNDLNFISPDKYGKCFSYTANDRYCVYNAAMKGVRVAAQAFSISGDRSLLTKSDAVTEYIVKKQNDDGSWNYAFGGKGEWIDNYHTGYVLDCLKCYIELTGSKDYLPAFNKGLNYYTDTFITEDGQPCFYNNKKNPVDCTSGAQTILTLIANKKTDTAKKVAEYMIHSMMDQKGYFYFRKSGNYTNKTSFMRWSNAWMFAALSSLQAEIHAASR